MEEARVVRGPEGQVYEDTWVFKNGSRTGGTFDFMVGTVAYLSGPPLHTHLEQYDTFYVLEGILAIQVGDEVLDLGPGDFASVPPGVPHTFDNLRRDQPPVKACNLMTPSGLDQFFVSLNEAGSALHDPDQFAIIAEKHGIKLAGPSLGQKFGLA